MLIEDRQLINARRPELWDFLMDIPKVAECMPGVADIRLSSPDEYEVTMKVKVGAIDLKFEAKLRVLGRDRENWTATMEVAGAERGVGGAVSAMMTMILEDADPATELLLRMDAKILGKLAEFGQPVMRRKAKAMTAEFAQRIGERFGPSEAVDGRGLQAAASGSDTTRLGSEPRSSAGVLSRLLQRVRSSLRRRFRKSNRSFRTARQAPLDDELRGG
jgi:carbon monoxide dehydrogenase subunit G